MGRLWPYIFATLGVLLALRLTLPQIEIDMEVRDRRRERLPRIQVPLKSVVRNEAQERERLRRRLKYGIVRPTAQSLLAFPSVRRELGLDAETQRKLVRLFDELRNLRSRGRTFTTLDANSPPEERQRVSRIHGLNAQLSGLYDHLTEPQFGRLFQIALQRRSDAVYDAAIREVLGITSAEWNEMQSARSPTGLNEWPVPLAPPEIADPRAEENVVRRTYDGAVTLRWTVRPPARRFSFSAQNRVTWQTRLSLWPPERAAKARELLGEWFVIPELDRRSR